MLTRVLVLVLDNYGRFGALFLFSSELLSAD